MRIIIVDDDAKHVLLLGHLLARRGHEIRSVGSAADAHRLCQYADFELLICDMRLSGMNKLVSWLRRRREVRGIALTGGQKGDIAKGRRAGFTAYLTKPVKATELLAAVEGAAAL